MIDFLMISTSSPKKGVVEVYPKFIIKKSNDLMIRGKDFYAIWLEEKGLWSTEEQDVIHLVDAALEEYAKDLKAKTDDRVKVMYMWDAGSGSIDKWHKYCQKQMRDNFKQLDEKIIFANTKVKKRDYASRKLEYPLEEGTTDSWDSLVSVLYSEEEKQKIEWAIGSVVEGDSKRIQKFMVFYGSAGTGKSTVLNIIQSLFDGYTSVFDARALGSTSNSFALEAFKDNPLVAIQHDGDLSRIEDNTRLNSLVSHEWMTVNEKFKATYSAKFNAFLFMGTNKPVKITDAKSGLIRRLIDVVPTGNKVPIREYRAYLKQIDFELGAIAHKCQNVYLDNINAYDDYIPRNMLGASNDFYNFIQDSWYILKKEDEVSLKLAWEMYKTYCDMAKVLYPYPQRAFKEELKNYFREYKERATLPDGTRVRSLYSGFITDKFEDEEEESESKTEGTNSKTILFERQPSILDRVAAEYPAQYASKDEIPQYAWDNVTTSLKDIQTEKLHFIRLPENHIVIDFDIRDREGNKNFEINLAEASKWPETYAEVSKSGAGIHLHYLYSGDVSKLSRVYDDQIEIKIFTGKSSLRRKLTLCNDLPIATISSGLPLKEERPSIDINQVQSEKNLRSMIKRNLLKEFHAGTKPSVDFIHKILEDAYASDLKYDVTDMRPAILAFAANSTNQAPYCIKLVNEMKFASEETTDISSSENDPLVFYDIEVFPNLFVVCYKVQGEGKTKVALINPTPTEIERMIGMKLVGFNCRRYDNHILWAAMMGYTNEQLYNLSQRIISGSRNAFFGEAYNVSYTDVYDFSSKKQSLKKFEIELGIHHQELGFPWDEPVPKELWPRVVEYCHNDVAATEATFNAREADFIARQILADLAGMTVNDTTNSLTTRIIFGNNRRPQDRFNYRDLAKEVRP